MMPQPGVASTWRRPHLVTPAPGDAQSGQPIDFLPWGPLVGPSIRLTLTLVNARGRVGTGLDIHISGGRLYGVTITGQQE